MYARKWVLFKSLRGMPGFPDSTGAGASSR
jgi:hypothetical protein